MEIVKTIKDIRARLNKATSGISADVTTLRNNISAKRAELKLASRAHPPRADLEVLARELVDGHGAVFLAREGTSILSRLAGTGMRSRGPAVPWVSKAGEVPWDALCAGDPEAAVRLLMRIVDRVEYEPGPPLAERPALIARLEAELRELEETEERLIDAANDAGLGIVHRPEVQRQREQAARKAELDAQAVANRAARQAALDEAHAAVKPRVGRSAYLSAQ